MALVSEGWIGVGAGLVRPPVVGSLGSRRHTPARENATPSPRRFSALRQGQSYGADPTS